MSNKQPWFYSSKDDLADKRIRGVPTVQLTKTGRGGLPRAIVTLQAKDIDTNRRFLIQGRQNIALVEEAAAGNQPLTFITGAHNDERKQLCATPVIPPAR